MKNFIFTSPGVKFREQDISFVTRNVGLTTLGLVGETPKGPAFEPIFVQDKGQFRTRFGFQNTEKFQNGEFKYLLPYYANSYLEESSQLYVTRILGLSGYNAGNAWAITVSGGVDLSTTGVTNIVTGSDSFVNNSYLGVPINSMGDTGIFFSGWTKTSPTDFQTVITNFVVNTFSNGSGSVSFTGTTYVADNLLEYENMVVAVLRSRAIVEDIEDATPNTIFDVDSVAITANETNVGVGNPFGKFTITVTNTSTGFSEDYVVSLNPNSREYLPNVIGSSPKDKNTKIFVESIYPDLYKKLDAENLIYGVNTQMINATSNSFSDYRTSYKTPETPWVVSELRGNSVDKLFKFISISDGTSANKEIKISIQNLDPVSKEFDVVVRDFNDNDETITILESFTRCTLRKGLNNYIGQRIGTIDGDFDLRSNYIMLEINPNAPEDAFPCGFEGYNVKDYASSATTFMAYNGVSPKIMYKTSYNQDERINRVYLGVSEKAYDSIGVKGTSINQNFFNYIGNSGFIKTKGFHMDSGATGIYYDGSYLIGEFEVGAGEFRTFNDTQTGVYADRRSRKFTLVPAGGFDGWDEHRTQRSHGDLFRQGGIFDGVPVGVTPSNDFQAWETGIRTFENPEEITINLFGTPGINWSDNNILINNTIEMIELDRSDSLYVIDSPDINIDMNIGEKRTDVVVAEEIVDLLSTTEINTSYAATYYPFIQVRDVDNNLNVFIPPTGEVLKAIAYTDNVKFPWFAPAGKSRGVIDARRSKYKLSQQARGILQIGRINPIADFADVGSAIFGQKTLQVRESALDRINVRRLLLQVKVLISNIATRLIFDQNDQATIDQFISKVNPILDNIRIERGLERFAIRMDDSNNSPESRDRNELYGEIELVPTKSLEYIGITFTISPSGASFSE